jgi:hypothetical protein
MDKEKIPVIFRPKAAESGKGEEQEAPSTTPASAPPTEMTPDLSPTQAQEPESAGPEQQGWIKRCMHRVNDLGAGAGVWWGEFLSGNQELVNTGAVLAVVATVLVMVVYGYYAFYLKKDLGDNLTALAQTILAAGFGGFAATEITKIRRGP